MKMIYLVISECRERGTNDKFKEPVALWAEEDREKALQKCLVWNESEQYSSKSLEFHYYVKKVKLFK